MEQRQKRKEGKLCFKIQNRSYLFNREQRVAVLPESDKNRSAVQEKRLRALEYEFQYNMFQI